MQIIGSLFYIILFITASGSLYALALLFQRKVLRVGPCLWSGLLGIIFFLIPIAIPHAWLFAPDKPIWIKGYQIASVVWLIGAALFLLYYVVRGLLAYRAVKQYAVCDDDRMTRLYRECGRALNMKTLPKLLCGTLDEPACVVTFLSPAVILNPSIIRQLSDEELHMILLHELAHVKRKHHTMQRMYDFVSALHWFNPLVWVTRNDFAFTCEIDCDNRVLALLAPETTVRDYTGAMLHMLELSARQKKVTMGEVGALGFLLAKQRFIHILQKPSKLRKTVSLVIVAICVVVTITFSMFASKQYFYPYSNDAGLPEYSHINGDGV